MSGCIEQIGRVLLVLINLIFLLVGLAITAVGFILRYGYSVYKPFLDFSLKALQKTLDDTNLGTGLDIENVDIGQVMLSLALGLIIGGLVLVALSFMGCCGACCKFKLFLWIYALVILVFVLIEVVAIGILYGKPDIVKGQAKTSLSKYEGLASSEVTSLAWNVIMIQFKCCGIDSYKDFAEATSWKKNPAGVTLITPGCFDAVWSESFGKTAIAVPVLIMLFIILAVKLAKDDDKCNS
ncbi:hypothetical protein MAR_020378 [Mya arenaria]|uniref:Tetraspanin n=1 Tax=Mya arenaria TaxID=6604 RepID=A0ABY7E737_MYAAR|nr:hypothetical protein MAR_020378 [Mya arenaria]